MTRTSRTPAAIVWLFGWLLFLVVLVICVKEFWK